MRIISVLLIVNRALNSLEIDSRHSNPQNYHVLLSASRDRRLSSIFQSPDIALVPILGEWSALWGEQEGVVGCISVS